MDVVPFPPRPSPEAPLVASATSSAFLLPPGAPLPPGTDTWLHLPDGARFAYVPTPGPAPEPGTDVMLTVDPFVRGNRFTPLHESPRALAALLGIAAARRVDSGPESERLFLFMRGQGLVFDQNGDSARFGPMTACLAPAGEPARLWAQGPEDVLLLVFQPRGAKVERRTLRSEIEKRRSHQA
ncbi:MAG TPA: hypothetical protein VM370_13690 [Candidatus Thermoplasmatota archaeon]|nr:hypothetical protein [Candidatus Thermoplasmatota archaeon]